MEESAQIWLGTAMAMFMTILQQLRLLSALCFARHLAILITMLDSIKLALYPLRIPGVIACTQMVSR